MTNKSCKLFMLAVAAAPPVLFVAADIVWAQTLPATSGNLWFYSPSHYPPSGSAPATPDAPDVVPPAAHRHVHHANGDVRC